MNRPLFCVKTKQNLTRRWIFYSWIIFTGSLIFFRIRIRFVWTDLYVSLIDFVWGNRCVGINRTRLNISDQHNNNIGALIEVRGNYTNPVQRMADSCMKMAKSINREKLHMYMNKMRQFLWDCVGEIYLFIPPPVADLRGREGRAPAPPPGSKFFQFQAVFGKNWRNCMLAPPPGSWRPLLGEILDPPLSPSEVKFTIKEF